MPNKWKELEDWMRTVTGQEFLDETVYGTVGPHTLNAVLQEAGLPQTQQNRIDLLKICDRLLTEEGV